MSNIPIHLQTEVPNKPEHVALKALFEGKANAEQQKLAVNLIINKFSRLNELAYIPGSFDGSAFLAGRSFVASRMLYYNKRPASEAPEVNINAPRNAST